MKEEEKKAMPVKSGKGEAKIKPHHTEEFKGYDLDELRYQRAILALKKEFAKEKVMADLDEIKKRLPFRNNGEQKMGFPIARGILGKVFSGLGYVDYFLLGFSVISTGRKIFSFFRKKK